MCLFVFVFVFFAQQHITGHIAPRIYLKEQMVCGKRKQSYEAHGDMNVNCLPLGMNTNCWFLLIAVDEIGTAYLLAVSLLHCPQVRQLQNTEVDWSYSNHVHFVRAFWTSRTIAISKREHVKKRNCKYKNVIQYFLQMQRSVAQPFRQNVSVTTNSVNCQVM